jgi:hypothetical protein
MDGRPAEQVIGEVMSGDERLLWTGRPRQGVLFRPADAFAIPFSILWTGFMVYWEIGVSKMKAPLFMQLWGIPFILVGAHMLVGRFFLDSWQRARTSYGLTTQRAIIVSEFLRRNIKSMNLRSLADVSLTERSDGTGTIRFGSDAGRWPARGMQLPGMSAGMVPSFEQIPNARSVFDQIRRAQA